MNERGSETRAVRRETVGVSIKNDVLAVAGSNIDAANVLTSVHYVLQRLGIGAPAFMRAANDCPCAAAAASARRGEGEFV